MSGNLESIVNIGPKLAAGLREIGITSIEELRADGSLAVWERLRVADQFDCAHSLLALEGAIQGIRWHQLPLDLRTDLVARAKEIE